MKHRAIVTRILCMLLALLLSTAAFAEAELNKLVLEPKESVGKYGGTLYAAFPYGYRGQAWQTLGFYEPLLGWGDSLDTPVPNVLEEYVVSEDATTFTMTIRKGLKWSNGDPVTTEDVRYQIEDVWNNKSLMTSSPSNFVVAGEVCKLEIVDEYTFILKFAAPNLFFNFTINQQGNTDMLLMPSAYLKQFNDKYVDEAVLTEKAKAEGFDDWMKLYEEKSNWMLNVDCPTLYAWKLASISDDNLVFVAERNPYYFKYDTAGNQLPYIDKVQVEYVDNSETLKLKVMSGEVDYIYAPTGETFTEWPMLAQNAAAGNYRLVLASGDYPSIGEIMPNLANQDPQKGALLANKDFRVALSYAINRQEIVDLLVTVADFKGEIAQHSIVADSPYYHEQLATQYTEYDVAKANELLDAIGLTARDDSGYRLGPDGQPMAFQLTVPQFNDLWLDVSLMVVDYWKAVGINCEAKSVSADLWNEICTSNEVEFSFLSTGAGGMKFINTSHVQSYACVSASWYTKWGQAFAEYITSNGEAGVEPPAWIYEVNDLCNQVLTATSEEDAAALLKAQLDLYADNFPMIGFCRPLPMFLVCSNDIKNGPQNYEAWVTFAYGVGANVNPCQFWLDR